MKKWLFGLLLLSVQFTAGGDTQAVTDKQLTEFSSELKQLLDEQLQAGTFNQVKKFPFLTKPIESHGTFRRVGESEPKLEWVTTTPMFNRLLISKDAIYQQTTERGEISLLTDNKHITALLFDVLTGELPLSEDMEWRFEQENCLAGSKQQDSNLSLFKTFTLCFSQQSMIVRFTDDGNVSTSIEFIASQ